MRNRILKFFRGEEGAVTVDWVALTAAVVGLAGVAITSIQGASGSVGSGVESVLNDTELNLLRLKSEGSVVHERLRRTLECFSD